VGYSPHNIYQQKMKEPKTPQAKKRLSLLKDCRNTYGENNKSSRTSIRWRKSWVNRTYRRDVKQSLGADLDNDTIGDRVIRIDRPEWKKCPDDPLGKILLQNKTAAVIQQLKAVANTDPHWSDKLANYLYICDLKSTRVTILVRDARALIIRHDYLGRIDISKSDLTLLENFLQQQPN
jgi:hypothetical protein